MSKRTLFVQRNVHQHTGAANRRGLILTVLSVIFMTILTVQHIRRAGYSSDVYDFRVHQITNQFVFSSPMPKLIDSLKLTDEKGEKGESLGCSVIGTVLAPRVDGMFWVQRNAFVELQKKVNLTHMVNQIAFHTEQAMDYVKPSISDSPSDEGFAFDAMRWMFSSKTAGHRNLLLGINGWTFTFPKVEATPPTENSEEVLTDHYVYEIGLTPNLHEYNTEESPKIRTSYVIQFLPHHIRFFRSDAIGAWQAFDETSQASYAIRADAVAFSYDLIDIAATLRKKKPYYLAGIVARILSALGGIYAFFVLAERIMIAIPALFGRKID
eukprot:GEMP01049671.1.p1 GENE.GEMP01049671.1~~GEMP01049671.1.p1  ORF type:complete len:325 (+),score=33.85 GEMP01049671.1:301-1275(+)